MANKHSPKSTINHLDRALLWITSLSHPLWDVYLATWRDQTITITYLFQHWTKGVSHIVPEILGLFLTLQTWANKKIPYDLLLAPQIFTSPFPTLTLKSPQSVTTLLARERPRSLHHSFWKSPRKTKDSKITRLHRVKKIRTTILNSQKWNQ